MDFIIRVFKASDDIPACYRYVEHHQKILNVSSAANITSNAADWMYSDNTFLLLIFSRNGSELYGGGRIQLKDRKSFLPVERALKDYQENVVSEISLPDHQVAELCGVWFKFNKSAAGYGLSCLQIIRCAVAIASDLGIDRLLAFCSPHTFPLVLKTGGQVIVNLGYHGQFYYPNREVISTLLVYNDLVNLSYASEAERDLINGLRRNAFGPASIKGVVGDGVLHYELQFNQVQTKTQRQLHVQR
jgi:hypothetical protein